MDQFENKPSAEHKHPMEVKENLEVIKEEFDKLKSALGNLIVQLEQTGPLGMEFSKGLNLKNALVTIRNNEHKLLSQKDVSANNFAFMLYPSGIIHQLARAY